MTTPFDITTINTYHNMTTQYMGNANLQLFMVYPQNTTVVRMTNGSIYVNTTNTNTTSHITPLVYNGTSVVIRK